MDVDIMLVRVLLVIQNMPHPLRGSADSILSRMSLEKMFYKDFLLTVGSTDIQCLPDSFLGMDILKFKISHFFFNILEASVYSINLENKYLDDNQKADGDTKKP